MSILLATNFTKKDSEIWMSELEKAFPDEVLIPLSEKNSCRDVEIAICYQPPKNALSGLPKLRFIQLLSAGVDGILVDTSIPANIPFCRLVDPAMAETLAHTALLSVMMLHRNLTGYQQQQKERVWQQLPQIPAAQLTVSVLGLGNMGQATARMIEKLGYRTLGWSKGQKTIAGIECYAGDTGLKDVLSKSDIVLNLLPLTPSTRGLFNAENFATMKRGASLINLARGAHVIDDDLIAVLNSDQLGHAILDVFNTEPLPVDSQIWTHPKITVFPHIAAITDPKTASQIVARNIGNFRSGKPLVGLVDRSRQY